MLERNGLRHGGFELREGVEVWRTGKVREMMWNADSEVLAIWIEREGEDVGECCGGWGSDAHRDLVQLWSMNNYHYYLKQEIFSQKPDSGRFRGLKWHPEQPLSLYLIGEGQHWSPVTPRIHTDDVRVRFHPDPLVCLGHLRRPSFHAAGYRFRGSRRRR